MGGERTKSEEGRRKGNRAEARRGAGGLLLISPLGLMDATHLPAPDSASLLWEAAGTTLILQLQSVPEIKAPFPGDF